MTANLAKLLLARPFGFITAADLPAIIEADRLTPVLVRCGGCRFTCAAQDAAHLARCIVAGGDYVRDMSSPAAVLETARQTLEATR